MLPSAAKDASSSTPRTTTVRREILVFTGLSFQSVEQDCPGRSV